MNPLLQNLTAAAPPTVVTIGQAGAWVGPLLVGLGAAALDYSAIGHNAWRDRFAVAGYYACAVSFVHLLGLAGWEHGAADNYNTRMLGACASLFTHGALLIAMFGTMLGPTRALATTVQAKVKFAVGGNNSTAKINQTLLGWTIAAAVTAPLSGTGGWGGVVQGLATSTTGLWGSVVTAVMHWLGG